MQRNEERNYREKHVSEFGRDRLRDADCGWGAINE